MDAEKKPKPQSNTLLRRQRELRNFTLQDVADKLYEMCVKEGRESGISADTVGRWERGISQPEAHYRAKLCELFGKSTTDLGLIEQKHLVESSQIHTSLSTTPLPPPFGEERYNSTNLERGAPPAVQKIPVVLIPTHQAIDLLRNNSDATSEQKLGALLALEAIELAEFFDEGWSVEELLESLRVVLPGVQAMSKITRRTFGRRLLQLGAAAFISGVAIPTGRHISVEDLNKLHSALGENIAAAWKLFQNASTAQVLTIAQAQLTLVQQVHALLYPSVRPFLYAGAYSLIGIALHFQARDEEALQAQHSAYIAAMAAGDPWYVAQSLICQADSYHALGQYDTAIQMIEEALRIIGKPTDSALVCAKAHLLTCWADNAMMLEDYTTAQEKLDISGEYLDQIVPNEEFDRAGWLLLAGKYALKTRDYRTAAQHFEGALAELPEQWIVRRTMTATGLAMAYARMKERDISLTVAKKLMPMLKTINAPMTGRWFTEYLQQDLLGMFPTERDVYTFVTDTYRELPQLAGVASIGK